MSLNKSFKWEVESHPWAVKHNLPEGFLHGMTAVSVTLSALYCAPFFSSARLGEMLKT